MNRAFNKMDHIRSLILAKRAQIFAASESWLTSDHPNDLLSIDGFDIFRDDRNDGRAGGGVVVWVRSFFQAIVFQPVGCAFGTNSVWLIFQSIQLCFICIYIPPLSVACFSSEITDFLSANIDSILNQYPDFDVQIVGDFNRINISYLQNSFDLCNVVNEPTRGVAVLDLVLLPSALTDEYVTTVGPPVATSDRTVLCSPKKVFRPSNDNVCIVHDLRESHVNEFVHQLNLINFFPMYDMNLSIDEKCNFLTESIRDVFLRTIPTKYVTTSSRDKPFVTPLIKSLINDRWSAYRQQNFGLYNHLSAKVKVMLLKEKQRWAQKAKEGSQKLWQVVNEFKGTKVSRVSALDSIVQSFLSVSEAVNNMNVMFTSNQVIRPSSTQLMDSASMLLPFGPPQLTLKTFTGRLRL